MNQQLNDKDYRWLVYKEYNHIPSVKVTKYNFDEIEAEFDNNESELDNAKIIHKKNIFRKFVIVLF